jgi:hypothetical protein
MSAPAARPGRGGAPAAGARRQQEDSRAPQPQRAVLAHPIPHPPSPAPAPAPHLEQLRAQRRHDARQVRRRRVADRVGADVKLRLAGKAVVHTPAARGPRAAAAAAQRSGRARREVGACVCVCGWVGGTAEPCLCCREPQGLPLAWSGARWERCGERCAPLAGGARSPGASAGGRQAEGRLRAGPPDARRLLAEVEPQLQAARQVEVRYLNPQRQRGQRRQRPHAHVQQRLRGQGAARGGEGR